MELKALHQACVPVTVLILAVSMNWSLSLSPQCMETSCYPATGDLLIGRADKLHASSTCGLERPTQYCIVSHLQERNGCFICDSRELYIHDNPYNHTINSIITNFEKDWRGKWWQSENGVSSVYIQVDFEAEFHLTHLIMKFRTFRPAAMLIERSKDFGRTWRVYRYFAKDCGMSFPGIRVGPIRKLGDVICESRYSDVEPSTEGEVIFRVLPVTVAITDPYAKEVRDLMSITNLRVNFSALHTLGDDLIGSSPDSNANYYYALYGMVLRGSCSCNGHASRCVPVSGYGHHPDMVHGKCECMHNTKGVNCECCDDFFNDLPWRPARKDKSNACKRCECNSHASTCHFDPAVYEASGQVSGGVCDHCRHNTDGQHCHLCQPFFYQDPRLSLDDPHICKPCDCDPIGSLFGGQCDAVTDYELGTVAGQCTCRQHIRGARCEYCDHGYWNLGAGNEDGCEPCYCDILGTIGGSTDCDLYSGQCCCKRYVTGKHCDRCQDGYWGFGQFHPDGCSPCDCDLGGAINGHCGQADGQCFCRPNVIGISCTEPAAGFYFPNLDHLLYEAEVANTRGRAVVLPRKPENGAAVTWTGPGFIRAFEGDIIDFQIDDIPLSLNYSVVVRYEAALPKRWDDVRLALVRPLPVDPYGSCANIRSKHDYKHISILPGTRHFMSTTTFCLESGVPYTLRMKLSNYKYGYQNASVLIDSIVLIPDVASVSSSLASDRGQAAVEDFLRRRCVEFQLSVVRSLVPEHCLRHIRSVSALIYNGAIDCMCHPIGSTSDVCEPIGGQCHCKANVIGQTCDQCAPGSHGFGPNGCEACDCDVRGSLDMLCDTATGQCKCVCAVNVVGQRCDRCQKGRYMFPKCQACECNERADECNDVTGRCTGCRFNSDGDNCERCAEGYFGDPGTVEGCQPCLCPGGAGSGVQHADSCRINPYTRKVMCDCHPGYTGSNCGQCEKNHFGQPLVVGGTCHRCECNDNIDPDVAESCDSVTGECTRCLYNTEGFRCERCQPGYYGDAVKRHNCKKCLCNILGSNRTNIHCDRVTGQCPCLPYVIGRRCDQCRPLYWKLASGLGCEPCDCDPTGSVFAQCNEFDGQCTCISGRSGRDCTQCPDFHWGSPSAGRLCIPCDCNAIGSINLMCNHRTGQCSCRPSVVGQKCDQCAPKTSGVLPNCLPCGECHDQWTVILQNLTNNLETVVASGWNSGRDQIPLALDRDLSRIEEELTEIKAFVSSKLSGPLNWDETRATILSSRDNLTQGAFMVSATDSQLRGVLRRLNKAGQQIGNLSQHNLHLKREIKSLRDNATRVSEFDPAGAHQSIRESSFRSAGVQNIVETATDTLLDMGVVCNQVDDIINEFQTQYNQQVSENEASLRRVNHTFNALNINLTHINHAVCGGYGSPCDVLCGGGGCGKCGQTANCRDGLVTLAADAYNLTERADALLRKKMKTNEDTAAEVRDLEVSCMNAEAKADLTLSRVEDAKNSSEQQRNDLQELLNALMFFHSEEEKASPSDVRQVAAETLQLKILVTRDKMNSLVRQIKKMLHGLKDVDRILKLTADSIAQARKLQQTADSVRNEAEDVLQVTQSTHQDIRSAEASQNKTSLMLSDLLAAVTTIESNLRPFESQGSIHGRLEGLREHLGNMTSRLEILGRKQSDNKVKAALARAKSRDLIRLNSRTRQKLKEVHGKYKRVVQQLNSRYNQTVVAKAKTAMLQRRLTYLQRLVFDTFELENSLSAKETTLAGVMSKLEELQSHMSDLLRDISKTAAHCVSR